MKFDRLYHKILESAGYHGTHLDFDKFDMKLSKTKMMGAGIYLSLDKSEALKYGKPKDLHKKRNIVARVLSVFSKPKNKQFLYSIETAHDISTYAKFYENIKNQPDNVKAVIFRSQIFQKCIEDIVDIYKENRPNVDVNTEEIQFSTFYRQLSSTLGNSDHDASEFLYKSGIFGAIENFTIVMYSEDEILRTEKITLN